MYSVTFRREEIIYIKLLEALDCLGSCKTDVTKLLPTMLVVNKLEMYKQYGNPDVPTCGESNVCMYVNVTAAECTGVNKRYPGTNSFGGSKWRRSTGSGMIALLPAVRIGLGLLALNSGGAFGLAVCFSFLR